MTSQSSSQRSARRIKVALAQTTAVSLTTPVAAARSAGLVYVDDREPGIRRMRCGRGFQYRSPAGKPIRDQKTLARIRALAVPPAWTSVWIGCKSRGHLQATGFDSRGRKQYRYHADWRAISDATKFHRLLQFASALPRIRRRVDRALALPGLQRDKILAAVIRLLDVAHVRIGNTEYADANGSYGLTTLLNRHASVEGSLLRFRFPGKSGERHRIEFRDARLARIVQRCSELPGQTLFQYLDEHSSPRRIGSSDVNQLLQAWAGADFTAKEFRTWAGTVHFLQAARTCTNDAGLGQLIEEVARKLGNTPAVCKKHYIHPTLLRQFSEGVLQQWIAEAAGELACRNGKDRYLAPEERLLLRLLSSQ